jgi:phage gpG-like protein
MIRIDMRQIDRLERDLATLSRTALPVANRSALTSGAFAAQKAAREIIGARMTLRNRYTLQSIQVDKATGSQIAQQVAVVGSVAAYMATQEFGGVKGKKGSEGVAIATSYAAGQGEGVKPRTRLPRAGNKLAAIKLMGGNIRATSKAQRNAIAVRMAARSGIKFVYLELQRRKGLFRVVGGQRKPAVRMVHDLSHSSVRIPRSAWLEPAAATARERMPELYHEALIYQVDRLKLFKSR